MMVSSSVTNWRGSHSLFFPLSFLGIVERLIPIGENLSLLVFFWTGLVVLVETLKILLLFLEILFTLYSGVVCLLSLLKVLLDAIVLWRFLETFSYFLLANS